LVDDIRILATVNSDACDVDSNIIRTDNNAMILEGIFGLILSFSAGGDKTAGDPAGMVLKGILQGNKIIQKEKNKEMDDSIHEELHQMTKDYIYKIGDLK
tara:strand:- start:75 stop:374 length:300 start_codon:yes stop_codon:yes gene_type:complete